MRQFGLNILDAAPYVVFLVSLFFVEYSLFGVQDALLGIVFQSFAKTMVGQVGLSFVNYLKHAVLFLIMSLCASVCGLHPVFLVCGSAVYIFCITLMNSDDYLPRNFFMLGMGFLLLNIYPIAFEEIPFRLVATVFAIVCTTGFIYLMRALKKEDEITRDRSFVMRAFDDIGFQLIDLAKGETTHLDPHRVYCVTQEYCDIEYGNVFRQGGVLSRRQRYTFMVLICAEQVADMIHSAVPNALAMGENERRYLRALSEAFLGFGRGQIRQVHEQIHVFEEFLAHHRLVNDEHDTVWRATVEALVRELKDFTGSRDNSTPLSYGIRYRVKYIRENFSLNNTQVRFAIQLSVIVGVSFFVSQLILSYIDSRFGVWIPLASFLMLETYRDDSMRTMRQQAVGTLVGIALFVGVVHFIPEQWRLFFVLVFGYGAIITGIHPAVSMAAGTQLALTALYPTTSLGDTLLTRLLFVLIGVLVAVCILYLFLKSRRSMAIAHKMEEMERVDERLLRQVRNDMDCGEVKSDRSLQLLYYLHMNALKLAQLSGQMDETTALEVRRLIEANYRFAMEAAHAIVFLHSDVKDEHYEHLEGTTQKLRTKIDELPLDEVPIDDQGLSGGSD